MDDRWDHDPLHDGYLYNGEEGQASADSRLDRDVEHVVTAELSSGGSESFQRDSDEAARAIARELEKESRFNRITINGEPFLNSDLNGLYLHRVGECSVCVTESGDKCAECGGATEDRNAVGGPVAGYLSVKPSHYHSREIGGVKGHEGIFRKLCYQCHRADRLAVYGPTYGEQAA